MSKKNGIKSVEARGTTYERTRMLRSDSEVEIDVVTDGDTKENNGVWLCDYSESRGGAEFIEKICEADDVDKNELIDLCNKYDWNYVI